MGQSSDDLVEGETHRAARIGIALAVHRPDPDALLQQLDSLSAQSLTDWVCFACWDSPLSLIRGDQRFERFFGDARFVFIENPERLGIIKNFERAIALCAAQPVLAIACCDQDDVWFPNKLQRSLDELSRCPALSAVHSDLRLLRADGDTGTSVWQMEQRGVRRVSPSQLLARNVASGCALLMDAELARTYPLIPPSALCHDHWYALLAALHGGLLPIEEPLLAYRQHARNAIGARRVPGPASAFLHEVPALGLRETLRRCRQAWERAQNTFDLAQAAGAPCGRRFRRAIAGKDAGLMLLLQALLALRSDPTLARSSFVLALGKVLAVGASSGRAAAHS